MKKNSDNGKIWTVSLCKIAQTALLCESDFVMQNAKKE